MQLDTEYLRRHYAGLSDNALLAVNRAELVEAARQIYDEEVEQRDRVQSGEAPFEGDAGDPGTFAIDIGPEPEWLADASCAHAVFDPPGSNAVEEAARLRSVLREAGIPCHIVGAKIEGWTAQGSPGELRLMVPGGLELHAASVLDLAVFNPIEEANWRSHLDGLTDEELGALDPNLLCAGILDRAARLRVAFEEEVERRGSPTRA